MDLGYKLKQIRNLRRFSQYEVADFLNVSQKTYSNYESCRSIPSTMHLIKLSEILYFDFVTYFTEKKGHSSLVKINEFNSQNEKIKDKLLSSQEEIIILLKEKIKFLQYTQKEE